jgi:recombination protein RecT
MEETGMKTDGSDQNTKGQQNGTGQPMSEEEKARRTLQSQITGMAKEFERALPGKIGVERMMRIVMTAILKTPQLAVCEPATFFGALLQALQLGLEVNTPLGQAYLIPRKKNDKNGRPLYWECNFQIGYQGLLDLCYRYGKYKMITAEVVYDSDFFDFRYGTKQFLDHRPEGKKGAKPTHVWALYQLENGGERFVVWTWEEAMAHGEEFSDSFNKSRPWASPWLSSETAKEEMAKKSVLKALLKYAPKSVEGQIEAAAYADGRTVIAEKFEDAGGGMKLSFDVKQIAPPDPEAQNALSQINGAGGRPDEVEPAGTSRANAEDAPAGTTQEASVSQQVQHRSALLQGGVVGKSGLFPADEAADLESGTKLPNFSR